MAKFTLHICGSIPIEIPDDAHIPTTPQQLQELFENCEVNAYDLDDTQLRLTPGHLPQYEGLFDA